MLTFFAVLMAIYGLMLPGCGAKEAQRDGAGLRPYTAADAAILPPEISPSVA